MLSGYSLYKMSSHKTLYVSCSITIEVRDVSPSCKGMAPNQKQKEAQGQICSQIEKKRERNLRTAEAAVVQIICRGEGRVGGG